MLGKTNACVGGSSGGSGDVVKAVNKTGAVINEGDKVWLSKDVQIAGSTYKVTGSEVYPNISQQLVLNRLGTLATCNGATYSITPQSATQIGSFSYSFDRGIFYMDDQTIFGYQYNNASPRIDGGNSYILSNKKPIAQDIFANSNNSAREFYKIDLSNGSVIKTWSTSISSSFWDPETQALVGNIVYQLSSLGYDYRRKITLNEDLSTIEEYFSFSYENTQNLYPVGTTSDNKYIICSTDPAKKRGYLRIAEVINANYIKVLSQSEMPEDLQEFYSVTLCAILYNPYTGILTVAGFNSQSFAIMKYENGTWSKLVIDLNIGAGNTFLGYLTLSDDLTRVGWSEYRNENYTDPYITNISNTSGYTALPYRFYNINKDSLVGKATTSADINETFEASTVLPDKVSVTVTSEDNVELTME